jgi:PleD family two-component response regulator
VTTSIGLASFAVHAPDVESLLHAADTALYDAKRGGRNRVIFANAEQEDLIGVDRP